jgi:S-DNA-T family DNA segregation ATPase FtsK/SpoIIIE
MEILAMAKSTKRKRKRTTTSSGSKRIRAIIAFLKNERVHFITGILVAFLGIFTLLSIISFFFTGAADQSKVLNRSFLELIQDKQLEVENWASTGGAFLSEILVNRWFGIFSILIPFFVIYLGLRMMKVSSFSFIKALLITAFGMICGSITSAFILGHLFPRSHINWGGAHGSQIEQLLENSVGVPGMILLVLLFILIVVILFRQSSMHRIQETLINSKPSFNGSKGGDIPVKPSYAEEEEREEEATKPAWRKIFPASRKVKQEEPTLSGLEPPVQSPSLKPVEAHDNFEVFVPKDELHVAEEKPVEKVEKTMPSVSNAALDGDAGGEPGEDVEILEDYDPKKDLSSFEFPTMELLKVYNTGNRQVDMREQNENKDKIIRTLRNYGIEITSIKATVGPTITLYEIVPQAGVRISRIRNLEDDIALSLSALGIRIIAPMPGKGTIGIEVPNKDPQIVSMQSVIASTKFQECDYELPVALGKTITNEVFIFDLTKMPHLLVAGATGQGKSVGLNAIITSLLYKKHPAEMKMVLIDPKMVEFNIYSTIEKHYLAKLPDEEKAIITDVTKVTQTLNSLTKEMDDRYELLMRAHVRTIKEYNEKFIKRRLNPKNGHRYLPYIVVVIDEFGDLIMTAGKEIEMPIARIAQKARAVGMHMVIATQRPTTNIITGTIKANFPARMAFRVTSQIDSRTILDATGANQLIGRGDMLFSQGSNLIRIQCAFVDTPEIEDISQYIGKQRGYESAFALPEVTSAEGEEKPGTVDLNDRDPLFDEAARLIVIHQQGSTSLIQRKFSIGYNRAGRLMDQLESAGIVGPTQGSKPRDVYISDEYSLEKLLDSLR